LGVPRNKLIFPGCCRQPTEGVAWFVNQRRIGVVTDEVGAGKTVAVRAALSTLDNSRNIVIYLPNPTVGVRGIHHQIVAALAGQPLVHHATLVPTNRRRTHA
jgi:type II secretory pathway predicted ATPase ExeA